MSAVAENGRSTDWTRSPAGLILSVALPRLARQAGQVMDWVRGYRPERLTESADELRAVSGAEGLAVLAALAPSARNDILRNMGLEDSERETLRELAESLGDADDAASPASALRRLFPRAASSAVILETTGQDERAADACLREGRRAEDRHDFIAAEEWYRKALAIFERLQDKRGTGASYHQLSS